MDLKVLCSHCSSWTNQELADACNADSDDMVMKFMSILCTRSFPHLRKGKGHHRYVGCNDLYKCSTKFLQQNAVDSGHNNFSCSLLFTVFQEFVKCSNKDIEQIIKKEMSGDVKNAFYAIGNNYFSLQTLFSFTFKFATADDTVDEIQSGWQLLSCCMFLLSLQCAV